LGLSAEKQIEKSGEFGGNFFYRNNPEPSFAGMKSEEGVETSE